MIKFSIEPYVGPDPLRFGMTPEEVATLLGPPTKVPPSTVAAREETRPNLSLGYSSSGLTEVVFAPGADVEFEGVKLFDHPDAISFLLSYDGSPFEWVGFIVFLKIGLQLSGFHDGDDSQKAIAVVKNGYWDEYKSRLKPFRWP